MMIIRHWKIYFESMMIVGKTQNPKIKLRRLSLAREKLLGLHYLKGDGINIAVDGFPITSKVQDLGPSIAKLDEMKKTAEAGS